MSLTDLQSFYDAIVKISGTNNKKEYLSKRQDIKKYLLYIYNPFFKYNIVKIKSKSKFEMKCKSMTLFQLLDKLKDRRLTGDDAMEQVLFYIKENKKHEDLIKLIFKRNLKIGLSVKQINTVFDNLIPTFSVSLGVDFNKGTRHFQKGGQWKMSEKKDGYRCLYFLKTSIFYSRTGKIINCLNVLKKDIDNSKFLKKGIEILDGEICVNINGKEEFNFVQKEFTKKNHAIKNPIYYVFDALTEKEFFTQESDRVFSDRIKTLDNMSSKHVKILEQKDHESKECAEWLAKLNSEGKEGIMLRKDCEYKGKRSKDLLKIKNFQSEDFVVVDVRKHETEPKIKSLVVVNKGNRVYVTGLTQDQYTKYYKNPKLIIGKKIDVQFLEETKDGSLRHPTLRGIY